jgi:hypothetical protein
MQSIHSFVRRGDCSGALGPLFFSSNATFTSNPRNSLKKFLRTKIPFPKRNTVQVLIFKAGKIISALKTHYAICRFLKMEKYFLFLKRAMLFVDF